MKRGLVILGFLLFSCASHVRYTRGESISGNAGHTTHNRQMKTIRTAAPKRSKTTTQRQEPVESSKNVFAAGTASWYGPGFHGNQTASGEIFDMHALTAAHKTLPFGTRVLVVNRDNGKSVSVTINDRGPYKKARIIDLSLGAAKRIGLDKTGVADVKLYLNQGD